MEAGKETTIAGADHKLERNISDIFACEGKERR